MAAESRVTLSGDNVTISREYWFSAAHQLPGHPKCGRLHGHNYKVEVFLTGRVDPATGMVLDYHAMDEVIKPIIDKLDHRYIMSVECSQSMEGAGLEEYFAEDNFALLPIEHSTAEELSQWLFKQVEQNLEDALFLLVKVSRVVVWETHKSSAIYNGS